MQLRAAVFAAIALCLALLLVQTDAWGKEGHQIVADIAYNRLNSNAQQVCLTPSLLWFFSSFFHFREFDVLISFSHFFFFFLLHHRP
jgi:hypothetical protein